MPKRTSKKKSPTHFPYFLISIGLLMLSFWTIHTFLYNRAIALSDSLLQTHQATDDYAKLPEIITFKGIAPLPVVEAIKTTTIWPVSPTKANHVFVSAKPGQPGNIIIYGHNTPEIFASLKLLTTGDTITITTADGNTHRYTVSETTTVSTTQTALLLPTTEEVLTLYTCTGFLDSKRFVVRARPI